MKVKMNLKWMRQPRVLGMLLAKLVLSVASPLAGQPNDGIAGTAVLPECAVVRAATVSFPELAQWQAAK